MLKILDLFSGIGGFSLGLERTGGFETVAFCEIEKFPQKVLAKHWPDIPIFNDVRQIHEIPNPNERRMAERRLDKTNAEIGRDGRINYGRSGKNARWITGTCANGENATVGPIDVITGGFPCQDISVAGKQKGIGEGTRSGLWSECARLVGEIRPRYAIFENVTALLSGESGKWFERVLWDISEVGYDAEWHCIPASELGAHHHRDRVWIICYPQHSGRASTEVRESDKAGNGSNPKGQEPTLELARPGDADNVADTNSIQQSVGIDGGISERSEATSSEGTESLSGRDSYKGIFSNTNSERGRGRKANGENAGDVRKSPFYPRYDREGVGVWDSESSVCRVANGIPDRTHRLKGLGNAVVPQIPELIGRAILEAENEAM
jgi:DNA (cytosine-5)-methyltransferase 1